MKFSLREQGRGTDRWKICHSLQVNPWPFLSIQNRLPLQVPSFPASLHQGSSYVSCSNLLVICFSIISYFKQIMYTKSKLIFPHISYFAFCWFYVLILFSSSVWALFLPRAEGCTEKQSRLPWCSHPTQWSHLHKRNCFHFVDQPVCKNMLIWVYEQG